MSETGGMGKPNESSDELAFENPSPPAEFSPKPKDAKATHPQPAEGGRRSTDTPSSVAFGSKLGAKATSVPTPAHDPDFDGPDDDDDETDDTPPPGGHAGRAGGQVI